jgi:Tol biopolymer transport system component
MDINGNRVAWLTTDWAYRFAAARQIPAPDGDGYLSNDGRLIVYGQGEVGARQIWVKNADGSNPRNLSLNGFDEYDPVWLAGPTPTPTATPVLPPTSTPTPTSPPRPRPTPTKVKPGV